MENFKNIIENIWKIQILNSIIIVLISVVLYKGVTHFLAKSEEKNRFKLFTSKKSKTYIKLIRSVIRYIFIGLTVLIVLQINGIDVSSIIAGVGILGAVFGLAMQDLLKDIIRGSSILSDNYFSVGDIVKYKDTEGKVIIVGLKTTKIQDLKTNNIISIANRNIEQVELVSNLIYIRIPMPYDTTVEKAEMVIADILESVKQNNNVEDCNYKGVTDLADSSIQYLIEVKANPVYKLQVRRDALRCVLLEMAKHGVEVPYNQIDVHQK